MTIPFGRTLRLGDTGPDVQAVKRALARAGFGPRLLAGLTQTFGSYAVTNLRHFQESNSLDVDGVYGAATHKKLVPSFDATAARLYESYNSVRHRILEAAQYFVSIEPRVHYTEGPARMTIVRQRLRPPLRAGLDIYEDCSSFATGCYWIAGAPDPNGRQYDGLGYTGTLCQHGHAVSWKQARIADLVFYGRGAPWGHVAIYAGNGIVISHGSERNPVSVGMFYRSDLGQIRSYL